LYGTITNFAAKALFHLKNMSLYLATLKLGFARALAYPTEIISTVLQYVLRIISLALLWNLVTKEGAQALTLNEMLSYFLVTAAIGQITMSQTSALGKIIRHEVRDGGINQVLVKPVSVIPYYYAYISGKLGISTIVVFGCFILGVIINPPTGIENWIMFMLLLIPAFALAMVVNLIEGGLSLVYTEVTGIKNAMMHIIRFLSGNLVPIALFPEPFKAIVEISPFPVMISGPASALNFPDPNFDFTKYLVVGMFWSILLVYLILRLWRWEIKKYEAIGI